MRFQVPALILRHRHISIEHRTHQFVIIGASGLRKSSFETLDELGLLQRRSREKIGGKEFRRGWTNVDVVSQQTSNDVRLSFVDEDIEIGGWLRKLKKQRHYLHNAT